MCECNEALLCTSVCEKVPVSDSKTLTQVAMEKKEKATVAPAASVGIPLVSWV